MKKKLVSKIAVIAVVGGVLIGTITVANAATNLSNNNILMSTLKKDKTVFDEKAGSYKGLVKQESYDQVLQKLGKPIREENVGDSSMKKMIYRDVEVYVHSDYEGDPMHVFAILVISKNVPTLKGIKVGDSISKLKKAYGEPTNIFNGEPPEGDYVYDNICSTGIFYFHVEGGKVINFGVTGGI